MPDHPTGTVTFLFADIDPDLTGWESDPAGAKRALQRYDDLLSSAVKADGGYLYKRVGRTYQVAFATASQALSAAADAQRDLHAESWGSGGPLGVRMALHTGVTNEVKGEYVGPLLNRVARVLAAGYGGQILVTEATQALMRDTLPPGIDLRDLGDHRLRDLVRVEHVFQLVAPGLPDEFPALKTLTGHPNNLPLQPTLLIGREKEVTQCLALLRRADVHLLTLSGPGGTGKSRLALEVAANSVDDFSDGVFFVGLASVSQADLVLSTIAQTLSVREGGGRPLSAALTGYLREKQMLLVLDNFEQVLAAGPAIVQLLEDAPLIKVLVTSRAVLRVSGEQEYWVPPLALPAVPLSELRNLREVERVGQYAAVALFVARAQALKPDFVLDEANAAAVVEICMRLDGLPLAIELAAARIKIMAPQAIAARLTARLKLLTGGIRDLPQRQQALRTTLDWSYGLLDDGERILFRRLAVFSGERTLETIEAVCNEAGDLSLDVLEGVTSLLDKSLLYEREAPGGEVRFWMLETVQEYGEEQLEKSGEAEEIRRRHAEFFLGFAVKAEAELTGPRQAGWLERLEYEHGNFRAALGWLLRRGHSETALRLSGALMRFWEVRGYLSEGRRWLEAVLAAVSDGGGSEELMTARAWALIAAGRLASLQNDYDAARAFLEQSLALWQEQAGQRRMADSLETGNKQGMARALTNLAIVKEEQGDVPGARALHEQSLALAREVKDQRSVAVALLNLGVIAQHDGEWSTARRLNEESLALLRALNDRRTVAVALGNLAEVALGERRIEEARALYLESLQLLQDLGDKLYTAYFLDGLAAVAGVQGNAERSGRLFGAVEAMREAIGAPLPPSEQKVHQSMVDRALSHVDPAAFRAAWSAGREMSLNDAVHYAFEACA